MQFSSFTHIKCHDVGFWPQAGPRGYQPVRMFACWYSLFWYPVFLAFASNVPQVTVPDIDARISVITRRSYRLV